MEKLIYAIVSVNSDPEKLNELLSGMKGIAGSDIYAVPIHEITAVVSDMKRADLITDKSHAIEYASVIEILTKQFTLIPMRFGSFLKSTGAITKMLETNYYEFQQTLQKVEGKFEFGLKVFCDPEILKTELRSKSEVLVQTAANPDPEIKNSVYREYINRKLKEHRLEELMLTYVDKVISDITGTLVRLDAINKFNRMGTPTNIIDAYFLLKKEKKEELIQMFGDMQNQYPALNLILTGPWPPYNFVDITIN
ncbi:MAG: GvpL/GvpF family gas vesicle protein [Bacteroidota bacterium]